MKKTIITLASSVASLGLLAGAGMAQTTLGTYEFIGNDYNPDGSLIMDASLAPTLQATTSHECVDLSHISPSTAGIRRPWSDDTSNSVLGFAPTNGVTGPGGTGNHSNCFTGWLNDYSDSRVLSFDLTFGASAAGQIAALSFDIVNYDGVAGGGILNPELYTLKVYKDNALIHTSANNVITSVWTRSNHDLSSVLAANSVVGESNTFTFTLGAFGGVEPGGLDSLDIGVIALDNVVIEGAISKVPEPSSTTLLGLSAVGLLLRRKR